MEVPFVDLRVRLLVDLRKMPAMPVGLDCEEVDVLDVADMFDAALDDRILEGRGGTGCGGR